jgi:hypothetical protein
MRKVLIIIYLGIMSLTSSSQQHIDMLDASNGTLVFSACEDGKGGYVYFYQMDSMGFSRSSILFVENKSENDSPSNVFYEAIEQTINH